MSPAHFIFCVLSYIAFSGVNSKSVYPEERNVPTEWLPKLDLSCIQAKVQAPEISHGLVSKYERRRHGSKVFLVAYYACHDNYDFERTQVTALYCSANKWVGELPTCLLRVNHNGESSEEKGYDSEPLQPPLSWWLSEDLEPQNETANQESTVKSETEEVDTEKQPLVETNEEAVNETDFKAEPVVESKKESVNETVGLGPCDGDNNRCEQLCIGTGEGVCTCERGFRLNFTDRRSCDDVDECAENNGGCHQLCINSRGSYSCACDKGYEMTGQVMRIGVEGRCVDIDECRVNNGGCSHQCENAEGSFKCLCPEGFQLAANSRDCEDVDECSVDNGGCQDVCLNEPGSFKCQCGEGKRLSFDQRRCFSLRRFQLKTPVKSPLPEVPSKSLPAPMESPMPQRVPVAPADPLIPSVDTEASEASTTPLIPSVAPETPSNPLIPVAPAEPLIPSVNPETSPRPDPEAPPQPLTPPTIREAPETPLTSVKSLSPPIPSAAPKEPTSPLIPAVNPQAPETSSSPLTPLVPPEASTSPLINSVNPQKLPTAAESLTPSVLPKAVLQPLIIVISPQAPSIPPAPLTPLPSFSSSVKPAPLADPLIPSVNPETAAKPSIPPAPLTPLPAFNPSVVPATPVTPSLQTLVRDQCVRFQAPDNGRAHCKKYRPRRQLFYHTRCEVRCNPGYTLLGSGIRTCGESGVWEGREGRCLRLIENCPALPAPRNGVVTPEICTRGLGKIHDICTVQCRTGFKAVNWFTSCWNGTWSFGGILDCKPNEIATGIQTLLPRQPYIKCPEDMVIVLNPLQTLVHVGLRVPETNVDHRHVATSPPWAKGLQRHLGEGTHRIIFKAHDPATQQTVGCQTIITIKRTSPAASPNPNPFSLPERKAPELQYTEKIFDESSLFHPIEGSSLCPSSFEVQLKENQKLVSLNWEEPRFEGKLLKIFKSHFPGALFGVGDHTVNYEATTTEGHTLQCSFRIHVKAASASAPLSAEISHPGQETHSDAQS